MSPLSILIGATSLVWGLDRSFLDRLDALPAAGQLLLPQSDLIVTGADGQNVAAQAPARAPGDSVEVQGGLLPIACTRRISLARHRSTSSKIGGNRTERRVRAGPDLDGLVLRCGGDVRLGQHCRRPSDVAHPVGVTGQLAGAGVGASLGVPLPHLDQAVAAAGDEAAQRGIGGLLLGAGDGSGGDAGGPRDGVDAQAVGGQDLVRPGAIAELEDGHVAVAAGAREHAACVMGRPGHEVDAGRVQLRDVHALPLPILFTPDEDLAVVAGRREDVAVLGVCPGDTPDCALVSMLTLANALFKHSPTGIPPRFAYPFSVSVSLWLSPSTSNIFIVLSEEHVASLLP